ncbi:MAG: tyrosine-type recombinase/integrase [Alphaproteobacteria bacterium]|nr:tyrosine-type recombinase/integrase [Alphaproteobacteria bacterium]
MPREATRTLKLTNRSVEAAEPAERRYRINDTDQRGFYLAVQPSGKKSFGVRYVTTEGKNSEKHLGDFPGLLPAKARELAAQMRSEVKAAKIDPAEEARKARQDGTDRRKRTFMALAEAYLQDMEARGKKRPATVAKERQHIGKHLMPLLGSQSVETITGVEIAKALAKVRTEASKRGKTGNSAANDCLKYARQVLKYGQKLGWLPKSSHPWEDVEKYEERPRERVATEAELKALWSRWEARKNRPDPRGWHSAAALQFALLTLQRGEEVVSLPWSEVDLEARVWTIPGERKKEGRTAVVPLSEEAVAILRAAQERDPDAPGPFVGRRLKAETEANSLKRGSLTQAFERDCEALKIEDLTPHDLRRTGRTIITNPERLGFGPHVGEAVISHAIGDTLTRTYDRNSYLLDKRRALEAWAREVGRIVSGNRPAAENSVVPLRHA